MMTSGSSSLEPMPHGNEVWGEYNYPARVNIQTHGLHISGGGRQNNMDVEIEPDETYTYKYGILPNHAGGSFWWVQWFEVDS